MTKIERDARILVESVYWHPTGSGVVLFAISASGTAALKRLRKRFAPKTKTAAQSFDEWLT